MIQSHFRDRFNVAFLILLLLYLLQVQGVPPPVRILPMEEKFILVEDFITLQANFNMTLLAMEFNGLLAMYNGQMQNLSGTFEDVFEVSECKDNTHLQEAIFDIEKIILQLYNEHTSPDIIRDIEHIPALSLETKSRRRQKRAIVPVLGSILHYLIGTGSEKEEQRIEKNQKIVTKEFNILQIKFERLVKGINKEGVRLKQVTEEINVEEDAINSIIMRMSRKETLNNICLEINKHMMKNLREFNNVGSILRNVKIMLPYGNLFQVIASNYVIELLMSAKKKFIQERIDNLPVFSLQQKGNQFIYTVKIPVSQYEPFNMFRVEPVIFIPYGGLCDTSVCTLKRAKFDAATVGLTPKGDYFAYKPLLCEFSSKSPIYLCKDRKPALKINHVKEQDCILDAVAHKNISACMIRNVEDVLTLPLFEQLRPQTILITNNKKLDLTMICGSTQKNLTLLQGSQTLKLNVGCELYNQEKQVMKEGIKQDQPINFHLPDIYIKDLNLTDKRKNKFEMELINHTHKVFTIGETGYIYKPVTIDNISNDLINNVDLEPFDWAKPLAIIAIVAVLITMLLLGLLTKSFIIMVTNEERQKRRVATIAKIEDN